MKPVVLAYYETNKQKKSLSLSRQGKIMKDYAKENDWKVMKIFRLNSENIQIKLLEIFEFFTNKMPDNSYFVIDSFETLHKPIKEFKDFMFPYIIEKIYEYKFKIFSQENLFLIHDDCEKEQWELLLKENYYHVVEKEVIKKEYYNSKIHQLISHHDWENYPLPMQGNYISNNHPDIFHNRNVWLIYVHDNGKMDNIANVINAYRPDVQMYYFRNVKSKFQTSVCFTIHDIDKTRLMLCEMLGYSDVNISEKEF